MLIPKLAAIAKAKNFNLHIVLTAPADKNIYHRIFLDKVALHGVEDIVSVVGSVENSQLASIYKQIDVVVLLSKLESFSNNILEAWKFKKPLLISDELWSRSICKNAAVYVLRDSVSDILSKLNRLYLDAKYRHYLINQGNKQLSTFPTTDKKIEQEFNFVKYIYENN